MLVLEVTMMVSSVFRVKECSFDEGDYKGAEVEESEVPVLI